MPKLFQLELAQNFPDYQKALGKGKGFFDRVIGTC